MKIDVLDHGYVELIETWGSDERVIESARMSTGKGFLGWGPVCVNCSGGDVAMDGPEPYCRDCRDITVVKPGDEKLLRYLWENQHHTPFEMAGLTIEVQAPIFVFREWHRHRVPFSYNEMSARYTPLPDVNYVPTVERLMLNAGGTNKQAGTVPGSDVLTEQRAADFRLSLMYKYNEAQTLYEDALAAGVPKELARVILPVGRYSRMRASANLRGWLNFLRLRMDPAAQYEIRMYANVVHDILVQRFPRTMALFDESRYST